MQGILLPPTDTHVPAGAINFLRVNWSGLFTVLDFWHSKTFTFFAYGILVIVTMMTFNPRFLQLRDKSSLLPLKEDTIQAVCFVTKEEILVLEFPMFF